MKTLSTRSFRQINESKTFVMWIFKTRACSASFQKQKSLLVRTFWITKPAGLSPVHRWPASCGQNLRFRPACCWSCLKNMHVWSARLPTAHFVISRSYYWFLATVMQWRRLSLNSVVAFAAKYGENERLIPCIREDAKFVCVCFPTFIHTCLVA